eukprot:5182531-Amphidinium_carterae.1
MEFATIKVTKKPSNLCKKHKRELQTPRQGILAKNRKQDGVEMVHENYTTDSDRYLCPKEIVPLVAW